MRILHILSLFILLFNCNTNKNTFDRQKMTNNTMDKTVCPDDGTCTFKVIKNKSAEVKKDEFDATYINIFESDKTLLKFEYNRNPIKNTEDSNYTEIIYIEINQDIIKTETINSSLSSLKNKVIFGRLCFCRGQTGYYNINEGDISISPLKNNLYKLDLEFKTNEVPQIINKIRETFNL